MKQKHTEISRAGTALRDKGSPAAYKSPRKSLVPRAQPKKGPSTPLVLGGIFVAVLLTVGGILLLRSNQLTLGAAAVVLGLVLFLVASRYVSTITWSREETANLVGNWLPLGVAVLGIFMAALATFEVAQPRLPAALWQSFIFWALSVVCFIAGILWLERWLPKPVTWLAWIRAHYVEFVLIVAVVAIGIGARLYALNYHPYPWSGDEATVGMSGEQIAGSKMPDLFNAGWSGNPIPAFYLTAVVEAILGPSILSVRVASAIVGALTVLFLYLTGRELFGRYVALIAATFLATFPYHLQFSRVGVLTIQDGFVVTFVLWLVMRAVRKDQLRDYVWAGVASGLTVYAYVGGRLVLALAFAALLYVSIRQKDYFLTHLRHLGVYLAATLITLAPMGMFFLHHLQDFSSRFAQVGIIQSGWLVRTSASSGKPILSILVDQFTHSTLVYVASPAYGSLFNSPQPYLTLIGALFFLLGMGVSFQKIREVPYLLLLTWFWSVVFLGGVLTISPPANTRMIMSAPAIALFIGIGLAKLVEILAAVRVPSPWRQVASAVTVTFLVVQGGAYYFGRYRAGNYFDDANAEVAMQAGIELRNLGPKYTFVMLGLPRMFSGFPTIVFLDPTNPRIDIDPSKGSSADLSGRLPAFIVATPDNLVPLQELAQLYPGGKWETVPSKSRNETLYYAYTLDATSAQTMP